MNRLSRVAALGLALLTAACATGGLDAPAPTLEGLQTARRAGVPPMRVGHFTAAAGMPSRTIVVRAGAMAAPKGETFADYLGDTFSADLTAAGKLDPKAPIEVSGVLDDSMVESAMPTAKARLGAAFTVTREGKVVFQKSYVVSAQWPSAFMGVEAIPDAMNHYTALYDQLVRTLLADPAFLAAVRS